MLKSPYAHFRNAYFYLRDDELMTKEIKVKSPESTELGLLEKPRESAVFQNLYVSLVLQCLDVVYVGVSVNNSYFV